MFRIKTRKKYFIPSEKYVLIKQSFGVVPCTKELKTGMNVYPVLSLSLKWQSQKYWQLKRLCWVVPMSCFTCRHICHLICVLIHVRLLV